jgi:hypothetical protein
MIIAIVWAAIFAGIGYGLGVWIEGAIGQFLIWLGYMLAAMALFTGWKRRHP